MITNNTTNDIVEDESESKGNTEELDLGPRSKVSLLDQHSTLKKKAEGVFKAVIIIEEVV